MPKRVLPKVAVRREWYRKSAVLPAPVQPTVRAIGAAEPEFLTGSVQGMKASQPEERFVNSLSAHKRVEGIQFRYTIGAPRGLPGWKEVDVLASSMGLVYAFEVDTAFTHRSKESSDVLHDAIVLAALKAQGMNVYPEVIHIDGETDLANKTNSDSLVKRMFG